MENKRELVIIAVIITLITVILIGIFLFNNYYPALIKNKSLQNEFICEKQVKVYDRDACYFQLAATKKDVSYCDKISIPYDKVGPLTEAKYNCYMNIALINNDEKICEKISNIWIHDWCLTQIFMIKKDVLICEKMTNHNGFKNDCYKDFAKYTNDVDTCKLIENKSVFGKICEKNHESNMFIILDENLGYRIDFSKDTNIYTEPGYVMRMKKNISTVSKGFDCSFYIIPHLKQDSNCNAKNYGFEKIIRENVIMQNKGNNMAQWVNDSNSWEFFLGTDISPSDKWCFNIGFHDSANDNKVEQECKIWFTDIIKSFEFISS